MKEREETDAARQLISECLHLNQVDLAAGIAAMREMIVGSYLLITNNRKDFEALLAIEKVCALQLYDMYEKKVKEKS